MNKRPYSVAAVGLLFVASGLLGLAYHLGEFKRWHPFPYELLLISALRLVAIVGGVYVLRGRNWARWMAVAWMAFHVVLSAFHSVAQLVVHSVLLALIAGILFRAPATKYFVRKEPGGIE
jgi:hypothetical protein